MKIVPGTPRKCYEDGCERMVEWSGAWYCGWHMFAHYKDDVKIGPAGYKLLQRVSDRDGLLLELQITSTGNTRTYDKVRQAGLIRRVDHPTVKDASRKYPAEAVALTDAGRAAITMYWGNKELQRVKTPEDKAAFMTKWHARMSDRKPTLVPTPTEEDAS